ncbi:CBS domain-containing protein CBSX3, mitochondrial [Cucumis melo]|uniref:CBS domain-containing protein CBSX3, mitochondrial n=1 Tax=Cucumis melo TaxID=3656 RepID=A0A1S4DVM5_CUCME|nr:CBS domain-containing protein CBSX3, mitochondrial [Cucumis melo]XP_016900018.1 CBS domain-containing protein CBSX3, mitochondrial [Cucumis melo]
MQGIVRAIRSWQETLKKITVKQYSCRREMSKVENILEGSELGGGSPSSPKSLENITVREIVSKRGGGIGSSMISCRAEDTAIEAVQNMARHNIGSLVVMKSEGESIAGIVTERDYLKKIIADGRSPIYTKVGEIMTREDKLVTITSDTNILKAMQLMTENRIRHVPVIDGKLVGMISIVDVVRAVVEQQNGELERLNDYIKGEYY